MSDLKDGEDDFTPVTPIMKDEADIETPRLALEQAARMLQTVQDLLLLGTAGFADPASTLRRAEDVFAARKAAHDEVLNRMLEDPGSFQ